MSHKCHFCVRHFGRVFNLPYNPSFQCCSTSANKNGRAPGKLILDKLSGQEAFEKSPCCLLLPLAAACCRRRPLQLFIHRLRRNNINCYLFPVLRKGSVLLFTLGPGG